MVLLVDLFLLQLKQPQEILSPSVTRLQQVMQQSLLLPQWEMLVRSPVRLLTQQELLVI